MKKIHLLYIAILSIAFSSCEKFLDVKPQSAVPDDAVIYDKISAETAIRGVFRQLGSSSYYGEGYVTLGYFPGGDVINNTVAASQDLVDINFRADDGLFNSVWAAIYSTINRANHVIQKVPNINDPLLTPALKNQIIGEAHFIRALAYFDLGRAWGGVPLKLQPTEQLSNSIGIPRSTLEETYAQVTADLDVAENLVPAGINRFRVTKNTVLALRARLYLYQQNWALADTEATKVINVTPAGSSDGYMLVAPFSAWFKNNAIATQESIFEIEYSNQNPSSFRSQMQHPTKGGTYRYGPNATVVALLNNPAIGGTATGRRALIGSVTQNGTTLWFGDLYYRSPATDPSYVLRIAEQYLIRAEARANNSNLTGAIEDLNRIRTRAGLSQFDATTLDTKEKILRAIEDERRFEFLWEGHRWFDLSRTGRAKTVLEALDPNRKVDAHEWKFPLPIEQVLLDKLQQNPGYQ
ncbi:MAG TPA: RagB/SusD family nutrient uptake outer membrane protein [Pedobacter sp.]|jgi:hypothetical protein